MERRDAEGPRFGVNQPCLQEAMNRDLEDPTSRRGAKLAKLRANTRQELKLWIACTTFAWIFLFLISLNPNGFKKCYSNETN